MWDKPFDTAMLEGRSRVAINCQSEDLERELAAILTSFGITYPSGGNLLKEKSWTRYMEDFCYYVEGSVAYRGPKSSIEEEPWDTYEKTTFYGEPQEDISDERFTAILGR